MKWQKENNEEVGKGNQVKGIKEEGVEGVGVSTQLCVKLYPHTHRYIQAHIKIMIKTKTPRLVR